MISGKVRVLVRDGEVDWVAMRKERFTKSDLMIELQDAGISEIKDVKIARLEPNGQVLVKRVKDEGPSTNEQLGELLHHNRQLEHSLAQMQTKLDALAAR